MDAAPIVPSEISRADNVLRPWSLNFLRLVILFFPVKSKVLPPGELECRCEDLFGLELVVE